MIPGMRTCMCGLRVQVGTTCTHGLPADMTPSVVRSRRAKEKAKRRADAIDARTVGLSTKDLSGMTDAMVRFDPVAAHNRARKIRANRKSHAPGARR